MLHTSLYTKHRDAAKAIVLHLQPEATSDKWEATMKVCDNDKEHTPMRMLIEHMPGNELEITLPRENIISILMPTQMLQS